MLFNERGRLGEVDSRVKITWLLATLIAGLIFARPLSLLIVLASIVVVAAIGGVLRETVGRMRSLAAIIVAIVLAEFGRIADAQKARAHALIDRGPIGRARGLVPIFVPLTLNAVDRADTVGKVLEIRGFARRRFRAEFDPLGMGSWTLLALSVG